MGISHIFHVYEDALTQRNASPEELKALLGEALWTLCMEPRYAMEPTGRERVKWHDIRNHGSSVLYVGEVHSSQEEVYIWSGNCLRRLDELRDDQIEGARRLFNDRCEERLSGTSNSM